MTKFGIQRSFFTQESCPICGQRLVKRYVLHPFSLPEPYGKGQWLSLDCACVKKERSQERSARAKILVSEQEHPLPPRLRAHNFMNFRVDTYNRPAYETCLGFAQKFERIQNGEGLLILGKAGVGKTHLASAIANSLLEKYSVAFVYMPYLLEKMRTDHVNVESLIHADLLVIDDLGTERQTEWIRENVLVIIDGRLNNLRPTIFTSNYEAGDLEVRLGMRNSSRILGNNFQVEIKGPDWRLLRHNKLF